MNFELSEEHKMIRELARDFVNDRLKPLEREVMGRTADLSDARVYLPPETEAELKQLAEDTGLWGANVPEELGGAGLDTLGQCLIEEELAQTAVYFNFGDVSPLLFDCDEAQREKYLTPALNGQKRPLMALLEPGGNGDLSSFGLKAEKDNDGWRLNGEKISFSRTGDDWFGVVFAVTGPGTGREGVSCFLVARDTPGLSINGDSEKSGWQAKKQEPQRLKFEKCRVSDADLLGEEGKAFQLGKKWLPARRAIRAARELGMARRLLEEATTRAQSWESFGGSIADRPGTRTDLADMAADIHAGELLVYEAATKTDAGDDIRRETALVKVYTTRMLYRVADTATRIFGGPPGIAGQPMERLCRSVQADTAAGFALDIQRNIIAADILKGLRI